MRKKPVVRTKQVWRGLEQNTWTLIYKSWQPFFSFPVGEVPEDLELPRQTHRPETIIEYLATKGRLPSYTVYSWLGAPIIPKLSLKDGELTAKVRLAHNEEGHEAAERLVKWLENYGLPCLKKGCHTVTVENMSDEDKISNYIIRSGGTRGKPTSCSRALWLWYTVERHRTGNKRKDVRTALEKFVQGFAHGERYNAPHGIGPRLENLYDEDLSHGEKHTLKCIERGQVLRVSEE